MTDYPAIPKPSNQLVADIAESVRMFLASKTLQDAAMVLEVHPGHLSYWLYTSPGHKGYTCFTIPKKTSGVRVISSPPSNIRILQNKFKCILDQIYKPRSCVYGFVSGKSIVDAAQVHKKKSKYILNIDLQDFYPTINFGRVRGLFISLGLGEKAASVFAHLVTHNGNLPQGAPTSPVISNMIAYKLDCKMIALARRYHLLYSRYADDLSLSTKKRSFPTDIAVFSQSGIIIENVQISPVLYVIVQSSGFKINEKKVRIYTKGVRQEITGLTVNEFVNVRRQFIRQIRAMIHASEKFGYKGAGTEYLNKYIRPHKTPPSARSKEFDPGEYFKQVVYGKLAFLKMVRGESDKCYNALCLRFAKNDSEPPEFIKRVREMYEQFDVFICHASEDKATIATPLYDALVAIGINTFIDNKYIVWGDSFVEKINHALSQAKIVVIVFSDNSVDKKWTRKEIHAALSCEISGKLKILPLMCGNDEYAESIIGKLPLFSDKLYKKWSGDPTSLAEEIKKAVESKRSEDERAIFRHIEHL